ncbi:pirin family protein [Alicycliphilus denitrificans]|uniref:pirin family protein n=1 Tax=Alicycliphilus denitrificans TaxID=179636 RepID=UPI0038515892
MTDNTSHPGDIAPQRYAARAAVIGTDTRIVRALPHRERRTVGAWCFLDHLGPVQFAPDKGMHVGAHPHIGLQTFTWMIEGEVVHRDSLGNEQIVRPGQVNLMTAGRGIAHTEDSLLDGSRMHAAQLWIALPDEQRWCEPTFDHYPDLPQLDTGGWRATVLAGSAFGQSAPARVYTPLVGIDLASTGAAHSTLALRPEFEYAAMALRGCVRLAGAAIAPGEWLYFAPGRSQLDAQCDADAQWLLLGGEPLGEDVLIWWNLVARSQAELQAALDDWNAGRFAPVRPGSLAQPLPAPSLSGARVRASGHS